MHLCVVWDGFYPQPPPPAPPAVVELNSSDGDIMPHRAPNSYCLAFFKIHLLTLPFMTYFNQVMESFHDGASILHSSLALIGGCEPGQLLHQRPLRPSPQEMSEWCFSWLWDL